MKHSGNTAQKIDISVVIPVFNSAAILPQLVERLESFFKTTDYCYELIFVNDGSADNSWDVLTSLKSVHGNMVIIDLLRNYGQHSAVFCGFRYSSGEYVVTMDDDLQNPPKEIIHLVNKISEGYDVVFGKFKKKMHDSYRVVGSGIVDRLCRKLFNKPKDLKITNFRIIRREVIDSVIKTNTSFPYIQGLLLMSGRRFANIPVEHHPRPIGKSNYNMGVILSLVWRIIINYSAYPLRVLSFMGIGGAAFAFLLGLFYIIKNMILGTRVPGWTTIVVLIAFYQGLLLLLFAIFGEFLVRISNDISGREAFHVRKIME